MHIGKRAALVLASGVALTLGFAGTAGADIISINGTATGAQATLLNGAVVLPPTPNVVLPPGGQKSVLNVNVPGLVSTGTLAVSSQGATGPAGSANSQASVQSAAVGPAGSLVNAGVIQSQCSSNEVSTTGASSLVNASLLGGAPINLAPGPNTTIPILIGTITLNEQQAGANSIRVRAVHASTLIGDVVLSESGCGVGVGPAGSGGSGGSGAGAAAGAAGAVSLSGNAAEEGTASATAANPSLTG